MKLSKFVFLLFGILIISLNSCVFMANQEVVEGNGVMGSEKKSIEAFERIDAAGEFTIVVTSSEEEFSATVIGDGNLLPHVEIKVENNKLSIKPEDGYRLKPTENLNVIVHCPTLKGVALSGAGSIYIDSLRSDLNPTIDLALNGSGNIGAKLYVEELKSTLSGGGSVTLKGKSEKTIVEINGSGEVETNQLETNHMKVEINGSGKASVLAISSLNAVINGSGSVKYLGTPEVTQTINGAGSVKKANE